MYVEVSKRLMDIDEYYKMAEAGILKPTDRVELIHGEIINMSPIGSKHAGIVNRLARILNEGLKGKATISVQNPVRLDENNEPEPDISILKFRQDDYSVSHPVAGDVLIIIEVADTTYEKDRVLKSKLYSRQDIPVYWIIDVSNDQIEMFTHPDKSQYKKHEIFTKGDEVPLLHVSLKVDDILV